MSHFSCSTCLLHNTARCPHPEPGRDFCTSYAPTGRIWDILRPQMCEKCPRHSDGVCGLSGMPADSTPSTECERHQAIMQHVEQRARERTGAPAHDMAAYPGMEGYGAAPTTPPAPAPAPADDMAAYPGMEGYGAAPAATTTPPAPASGDDMTAYPGMAEFLQGGTASGLTDAPVPGGAAPAPTTTPPAPAPAPADDMAAYPGMAEFLQGGTASGLTDAPATGSSPAPQPQGGQQRNRRAGRNDPQQGSRGNQPQGKGGQQGSKGSQPQGKGGQQGSKGNQPQGKGGQQGSKRGQQQGQRPADKKRSPHLYFLNPCSILGMLFVFMAFGFIFCVPQWKTLPMETGVCILALTPVMSLVMGLVWGVMNPQCRPVQFAMGACLGVGVGRMFWQGSPFSAVLFCVFAGFITLCVCFLFARLGTLITNAIFRVKKRMRKLLPEKGE